MATRKGGAKGSYRRPTRDDDLKMRRTARRTAALRDGTLLAHRSAVFTNRAKDRSRQACRGRIEPDDLD